MTMEELSNRLPNGLHDAYLLGLNVDYTKCELRLELKLDVSAYPQGNPDYSVGTVLIRGLRYLVIDGPPPIAPGDTSKLSYIDGIETRPWQIDSSHLPPVGDAVFRYSIFMGDWNSYMHFAGESAEIEPGDLLL
ncbi:hypothetical protein SAMN05421770_106281 [Granulicella rosea]|uniref:Uncharacterized protein n=1 Tax=Granulicella rosea TaxID=474952 RepID=A0A239LDH6_9BACT|nr:hypothetical protein [Granulicella rosea]SNT27968.1 hypothetical protein SAMN05421770_106281 [Granulicella rosea]